MQFPAVIHSVSRWLYGRWPDSRAAQVNLASLASGLILYVSMPTLSIWWLAWFGLIPLCWAVWRAESGREAFRAGLICGLALWCLHIFWIFQFVARWTLNPLFALIPWLALAGLQALHVAVGMWLAWWLIRRYPGGAVWWFALCWVGLEHLRGMGPIAFQWGHLALTHWQALLPLQSIDLLGARTLSAWIAVTSMSLLCAGLNRKIRILLPAAGISVVLVVYGAIRLHQPFEGRQITAIISQPNVDTTRASSWRTLPAILTAARRSWAAAQAHQADLIVFPEAFASQSVQGILHPVFRMMSQRGALVLTGGDATDKGYNAAILYRFDGSTQYYAKQHLVPWGEYMPLRQYIRLEKLGVAFDDRGAGSESTVLRPLGIGAPICFESTLGWVSSQLCANGARILCVITKDTWFGKGPAAMQHATFSALRAVENRRWVLRAAMTGISAAFDPHGRVSHLTPLFTPAEQVTTPHLLRHRTLYNRLGDGVSLGVLLGLLGAAGALSARRSLRQPPGPHGSPPPRLH